MVPGSPELREYLESRGDGKRVEVEPPKPPCTTLPEGYHPLDRSDMRKEAPYITYLSGRGVSERTVELYRMGYVDDGWLAGRVIIPSFDRVGSINFWSARSIFPNETLRYRLPANSKDVISNEHMVDWKKPVYLVEGIFDEIAIGPQAIALYGKFMPPRLALRLVEQRPPMIYVCLDADAREEAMKLMMRLVGYDLKCSLLDLAGKDPGDIGETGVVEAITRATVVTGSAGLITARGIG